MNPLRIEANNLGVIEHGDHDLTNVSMAVVVGKNGKGKSTTFTITPTWVLFGTTKNKCQVDAMIRTGQTEMSGTVEFEHRGKVYRTTRTRSSKGRGKSTLELFELINGKWESVGGTSIDETQAKINELVGLDAATFTATSMILQGRANEFTDKQPSKRKDVLQQILGLEKYDNLQEQAKKNASQKYSELERMKGRKAELESRTGNWEEATEKLSKLKEDIDTVEQSIKKDEISLQEAEKEAALIDGKISRCRDLKEQVAALNTEIMERAQAISKENTAIGKAQEILDAKEFIEAKAAEHKLITESIAGLETMRSQETGLKNDLESLRQRLVMAKNKDQKAVQQIDTLDDELFKKPEIERLAGEYREAVAALEAVVKLSEEYQDKDHLAMTAHNKYDLAKRNFESKTREINSDIKALENKVSMLANANCVDPENATCRFLADAIEAKKQLPIKQRDLQDHLQTESEIMDLRTAVQDAIKAREEVGYSRLRHSEIEAKVQKLRPYESQLASLVPKQELRDNLAAQLDEIRSEIKEITDQGISKKSELEKLTKDMATLIDRESSLKGLKQYVDMLPALANAEGIIKAAGERIATLQAEIDQRQEQRESKLDEAEELTAYINEYQDWAVPLEHMRSTIQTSRDKLKQRQTALGAAEAEVLAIEKAETEITQLVKDMEPVSQDLVRWQTLARAFSRDGVPAMIIESAVPELEYLANDILGQMTRGQNSLFFNTQRDKRDGKGIIETLDIMITDWESPGGRPYETFSGGEQLRIDFALRFALSELLARRAGSKVEWLTIDEGLGSQDAEHRALVLEAIRNVANRFKKVILITHIEEAQATFDEVINF